MTSLFNSYSTKGNLKFYKIKDNDEKLTISINITANHELNKNIYENVNMFLEKLLIEDYENEETYNRKVEEEKNQAKQMKAQEKYRKDQEKKAKQASKPKKIAKSKSLY